MQMPVWLIVTHIPANVFAEERGYLASKMPAQLVFAGGYLDDVG